jgi:Flp pilus assembly protein TadD
VSDYRSAWLSVLLFAGTLLLYAPVRHHEFINYDDPEYVTENRYVKKGLTAEGVQWAFGELHGENTYWHPVTWLSHMLDVELFGLSEEWHHMINVIFHAINAVLVFAFFRYTTRKMWVSWFVAALFAVHPLQVDTVAWVTERKNVLSTMFWMLTLLAYARYARGSEREPQRHRGTESEGIQKKSLCASVPLWFALCLVFFALGLMSKPMLVTVPFVLLLLDYWPLGRFGVQGSGFRVQGSRLVLEKIPFFAMAIAVGLITVRAHVELGALQQELSLSARIENAVVSYARYLLKALWPTHLAVFYPHPGEWPTEIVVGSALLLLGISAVVIWKGRRLPFLIAGWCWFLGTLTPTIGIIHAGAQAMADRFAYVPLIGLFVMICWTMAGAVERRKYSIMVAGALGSVALIASAVTTSVQLRHWQNSRTLFEHALAVTRDNVTAHFNLGNALIEQGQTEAGMEHLREALRLNPHFANLHAKYARTLMSQNKPTEAAFHYREALRLRPNFAGVMNNLAWLLATHPDAQVRNGAEAVRLAERACEITHRKEATYVGTLAAAYAEVGRFDDAVKTGEEAAGIALAAGDQELAATNRRLVELYRSGKPFRG